MVPIGKHPIGKQPPRAKAPVDSSRVAAIRWHKTRRTGARNVDRLSLYRRFGPSVRLFSARPAVPTFPARPGKRVRDTVGSRRERGSVKGEEGRWKRRGGR
jgi:hypothetical protein